jgi:hypothetical protein
MTLLRRALLKKLEARFAPALGPVGLVWSRDESLFDGLLEPGEYIARDMRVLAPEVEGGTPAVVRMEERVTRDANDLGWIYGAAGAVVGRVTELNGSLVSWRLAAPVALGLALDGPAAVLPAE